MRKLKSLRYLPILLVIPSLLLVAFAHPGRTDSNGGHTNHSTGEYHYHHGYSAHDHYDMDGDGDIDCPYDFDAKTEHRSNTSQKKAFTFEWGCIIAVGLYIFFMFILPFLMS